MKKTIKFCPAECKELGTMDRQMSEMLQMRLISTPFYYKCNAVSLKTIYLFWLLTQGFTV